jgi:hypothetical protein
MARSNVPVELVPNGLDHRRAVTLVFEGGTIAPILCGLDFVADSMLQVERECGAMTLTRVGMREGA